jgi:diguanylate cyclase (GGDEF)-like protein
MPAHVPQGHRDVAAGTDGEVGMCPNPASVTSRDYARALAYEFMIDGQMQGGEQVVAHARHLAAHAHDRGWPDVRALAGYVVVVTRWLYDPTGQWAADNVDGFVRWAQTTEDPLAITLSLTARVRAGLHLGVRSNPLEDLINAYVASERVDATVERAFALHEIAGSLHQMQMWELATEIYDIVSRMTTGLQSPRALVGAVVANRFYALASELLHARESECMTDVQSRINRVAALPSIDDLGPAVPAEWRPEIAAYAAICRALVDADSGSAATVAGMLSAPCDRHSSQSTTIGRRSSRSEVTGLLRCVLGWHHLQHGRWDDAEPLILQGAGEILNGTDTAFRSFALWLRATVSKRAMRDGDRQAQREYHTALRHAADDARAALVKSTRARLQTEHLRAERDRFALESLTDSLTGLANRRALEARLRELSIRSTHPTRSTRSTRSTLIIVDVDRFKPVNDRFGHEVGDQVLRRIGRILRDCVRPGDLAARLGGDEFVLVLEGADEEVAIRRGHEVRDRIRAEPWSAVDPALNVAASVGVACGQHDETALYRAADEALYQAKRAGGARVRAVVSRDGRHRTRADAT